MNEYTSPNKLSLANLKNGAAIEAVDEELAGVLENIQDLNTQPTAVREITMKVKIKPDEDRSLCDIMVTCWPSKLAPRRIVSSKLMCGIDHDGIIEAREFVPPGQIEMFTETKPASEEIEDNPKVTQIPRSQKEGSQL